MYLYFPAAKLLRYEEANQIITTLKRKGWQEVPDPTVPGSTWDGTKWVAPAPEPEPPRWVQFGVALGNSPQINQFIAGVAEAAPVLHLMLGVGLGQAAQGDPKTFLAAWAQAKQAGAVSSQLASFVANMAESFGLPDDFVAALTA
jgi:hypothetical protein